MTDANNRPSPEEAMRKLEEIRQSAEDTIAAFAGFEAELDNAGVEATSDDGMITVRLNAEGKIDAIELDDGALRRRGALGEMVKNVIEEAKAKYALKVAEMTQRLSGTIDVMGMVNSQIPSDVRNRLQ
ncbi:YbaB/EbfC family nucleoid-associated protein [Haloglycomyces albus]|uniref:YbaB/EbfC family nucleoid-associated protein n=1 Tax=Haloglycomyces albus TaxID=526067 RepID=UPI00046D6E70|nr:YbaB/EbfC family nucleoid-associated protein [Haloglycomyces albus]